MTIQKGISVVICTYNGAALLPTTLRHLAGQQVPDNIAWEVLVINNASTDDSVQVAQAEWLTHHGTVALQVIDQPLLGLNYARELGFARARYSYIIMCDDDNWLASDYVTRAYTIMEQNPAIGMLGGHGEFVYESVPPKWATEFSIHAGGPQAPVTGKVPHFGVYGAGSVLRKTAYLSIQQAGFTYLLTDRLGNQLSSGGDFELCYGLAIANYLIWYDESLRFKHFIHSKRLTWSYYVNYLNADASSFLVLEPYKIFLTTNSKSELIFTLTILKRFTSYFISLIVTLLIRSLPIPETKKKVKTLKVIALKARLNSYKYFRKMRNNFLASGKLRQAITGTPVNFYEESVFCES